jgi:hypothetical protein
MKHILNFKTKNSTPFTALKKHVSMDTLLRVPGGTASQDIKKSKLSPSELDGIASMGCELIYSVNLNNPVSAEFDQITTLIQRNKISFLSAGNENYANPDLTGVKSDAVAYELGRKDAKPHLDKVLTYTKSISLAGVPWVLVGALPSNQQGARYNAHRKGWNFEVIKVAKKHGCWIDFHAYHRVPGTPFCTNDLKEVIGLLGSVPAMVTECSALPYDEKSGKGHLNDTFTAAAIDTVQAVASCLRPIDIMGMHPFHSIAHAVPAGYGDPIQISCTSTNGMELTELGAAFFNIVKKDHLTVINVIDKNGKENPSKVRNIIILLSDGRELAKRMIKADWPELGSAWEEN